MTAQFVVVLHVNYVIVWAYLVKFTLLYFVSTAGCLLLLHMLVTMHLLTSYNRGVSETLCLVIDILVKRQIISLSRCLP